MMEERKKPIATGCELVPDGTGLYTLYLTKDGKRVQTVAHITLSTAIKLLREATNGRR